MKVMVTGATGYVGGRLALQLASDGHEVNTVIRSKNKAGILTHPLIRLFEGDILNKESLASAAKGCEAIYHLAAYAQVWSKDPDTYRKINVGGCENVLEAARAAGVKRVIFTSTAGVFGPSDGQDVIEDSIRSIPFLTDYESTKAEAENKCREYALRDLEVVIVNPTRVYGPGQLSDSNAVTKLIKLYKAGKWRFMPGDGSSIDNYVFIDDV
ncbi:MAG: NAD-dependent epimerase/dehydratase family protein, partial [Bacteroidota bacterium]|nr:NAD-dependent epimerase/dehydratase family protein [Bacteroidota bacterium]